MRAMLRKASAPVRVYLGARRTRVKRLPQSRVRQCGVFLWRWNPDGWTWLPVLERVDLFLQTREFRLRSLSSDLSPDCHQRMLLKTIQTTAEREEHALRCGNCLQAYATFSLRWLAELMERPSLKNCIWPQDPPTPDRRFRSTCVALWGVLSDARDGGRC